MQVENGFRPFEGVQVAEKSVNVEKLRSDREVVKRVTGILTAPSFPQQRGTARDLMGRHFFQRRTRTRAG
jgi:hypothetical protein